MNLMTCACGRTLAMRCEQEEGKCSVCLQDCDTPMDEPLDPYEGHGHCDPERIAAMADREVGR